MLGQTKEVVWKLTIYLCTYSGLFESQQYESKEEETRIKQLFEKLIEEELAKIKAEKEKHDLENM